MRAGQKRFSPRLFVGFIGFVGLVAAWFLLAWLDFGPAADSGHAGQPGPSALLRGQSALGPREAIGQLAAGSRGWLERMVEVAVHTDDSRAEPPVARQIWVRSVWDGAEVWLELWVVNPDQFDPDQFDPNQFDRARQERWQGSQAEAGRDAALRSIVDELSFGQSVEVTMAASQVVSVTGSSDADQAGVGVYDRWRIGAGDAPFGQLQDPAGEVVGR